VARRVAFFPPLSLPFFVLTSSSTKQLQRRSHQKNKKKREIALFLSRSLFHEKALFTTSPRRFFSPLREFFFLSNCRKQKKRKKSKTFARNVFIKRAHSRTQEEREEKRRPISNESNFFLLRGAFCLCFSRSREGEEETLRGGLREREGNGSLSLPAAYSHFKERDKKVTTNFSHPFAARAQKRDRATETEERKNAHLK